MAKPTGIMSDSSSEKRRKKLMELITSLRTVGVQAELDLPRIVCIGNQSAGKSSLVEAISGIHVPRDSGTCTRCPLECRLAPTQEAWSAQVFLRKEFDDVTGKHLPQTETIAFGSPITDSNETEIILRRAQLAILNPQEPHETFIDKDLTSEDQKREATKNSTLKFSKNVVCIDIWSKELVQLVFMDLPGIIQNAEKHLIDLVESMVTDHIKGNSIILVAIPMTDDLETQRAARMAKGEDPEGLRTIVAVTKLDLVGERSIRLKETWLNAIEGRAEYPLKHGYYGTRQLDDKEREEGVSLAHARQIEAMFFAENKPWSTSRIKEHLGIPKLTEKLSALLTEKIQESLPRMHKALMCKLDLCVEALREIPPSVTGDPSSEILSLITEFSIGLQNHVDGAGGTEVLVQKNSTEFRRFKDAIHSTAPNFQPFIAASDYYKGLTDRSPEMTDESEVDVDQQDKEHDSETETSYTTESSPPIYLTDVRNYVQRAKTRELPDIVPFQVRLVLIKQFTTKWISPVETCLQNVRQNVLGTIEHLIRRHFGRFAHLRRQVRTIVMGQVEACYFKTKEVIDILLSFETSPFTQNDHYYQRLKSQPAGHYKSLRSRPMASAISELPKPQLPPNLGPRSEVALTRALQNNAISALAQLGFQVSIADLNKLAPSDEYLVEMLVASQVPPPAALKIGARIIDVIPMSIDHVFLREISKNIQKVLTTKLEFGNSEKAAEYLTEDVDIASQRRSLEMQKNKLESARNALLQFGMSFSV